MQKGIELGRRPGTLAPAERFPYGVAVKLPPHGEAAILRPPLGEGWGGGFHRASPEQIPVCTGMATNKSWIPAYATAAILPPPLGEGWGGGFHGASTPQIPVCAGIEINEHGIPAFARMTKKQNGLPSFGEGVTLPLHGEAAILPPPLGEGWGGGFHRASTPQIPVRTEIATNESCIPTPVSSTQPPKGQGASQ